VPISWLRDHACPAIKWRTVKDILPPEGATEADREALLAGVMTYKPVMQIIRRQKANGTWGDNILGADLARGRLGPEGGSLAQYRKLVELGVPHTQRVFRLAERVFFRLLSRDEAPDLLFEAKPVKADSGAAVRIRSVMREGAAAALAHGGLVDDPRVRGAAHRIASDISHFLRSELAEKPFIRRGNRTLLHPEAYPPSLFSVSMIAFMPGLQRERAGFVERLAAYLARPAGKRDAVIQAGKRFFRPTYELFGDPIHADSAGRTNDLRLALHWIELLARLGTLHTSETAHRILARLLKECDERGVWNPKGLRTLPKGASNAANFAFPLEADSKKPESRQADVTFRLALIAKLAGWQLSYT
jgi:hypothetical protein